MRNAVTDRAHDEPTPERKLPAARSEPDTVHAAPFVLATLALWALVLAAALLLGALLLGGPVVRAADPVTCSGYPEPRVLLSSQSWWTQKGEAFPGRHIHLEACFPLMQTVNADHFDLDVRVHLHGQPGKVTLVRSQAWSGGSNRATVNVPVSFECAVADCSYSLSLRVDLPRDGLYEIRLTANIKSNVFGARQYQTTRYFVCARTCSGGGASVDRLGAAGWYTGTDYTNVRIRSVDGLRLAYSPVTLPTTVQVWGEDTTLSVHIDPDFHGGNRGTILFDGAGGGQWRNVTIPTLPSGPHRLVLVGGRASAAGVANGVFVLNFEVP